MPMKTELYVSNWRTIHLLIKWLADWRCVECDRPCRRPGESKGEFVERLLADEPGDWYYEAFDEWYDDKTNETFVVEKTGRFVLTVAHLDQNPQNNSRENLKALCPKCHNRHDAPFRAINRSHTLHTKIEKTGQLRLPGLLEN